MGNLCASVGCWYQEGHSGRCVLEDRPATSATCWPSIEDELVAELEENARLRGGLSARLDPRLAAARWGKR